MSANKINLNKIDITQPDINQLLKYKRNVHKNTPLKKPSKPLHGNEEGLEG